SNILKPALARGEVQLIGATTLSEYRKYVERDAALERRLQPVHVEETTKEETLEILKGIISRYEEHHNVRVSEAAMNAAVELSVRYIHDRNLPDKAIDILDEATASIKLYSVKETAKIEKMSSEIRQKEQELEAALVEQELEAAAQINKELEKLRKKYERAKKTSESTYGENAVVKEEDVEKIVSVWTKIPVTKLAEKESEKLLKLEKILHERVIGQDEAVRAVAKAVRRGRVGLKDPNRPIGSFLFLGPTGVGKTELSKALAQAMFDSEDSIIRVDMSEYMEGHSVSKMIGSPPGYVGFDEGGQLSEKVRKNPYSVVLFDEIEKAHPDVFNVLLQVLDDGHITDAKGRKVSFKNTILIMTSNVGAKRIMEPKNLGFQTERSVEKDYERMKQGVMEEVKRIFKPEFINRIDEIMVFHALNHQNMMDIMELLTNALAKRCEEQLNIHLKFTTEVKEFLVKKYADAKMGARPLKRGIQSAVEDLLAEEILAGKVKSNDSVTVMVNEEEIQFSVK
ncbi:MAG: ATP-dependent Clp protease ATP-binding subunit, partial [Lachnospiraceae bacterium]|nr:ATP-dependent Clp protease ATP-binding subunit [Lachnospiraceae bacterium]